MTIGRVAPADILIPGQGVSGRHAKVAYNGQQLVIEDLGSTNGTFVTGAQFHGPTVLSNGDTVRLGQSVELVCALPAAQAAQPPAPAAAPPAAAPPEPRQSPPARRVATGRLVLSVPPVSLDVDPAGRRLLVGTSAGRAEVWSLAAITPLQRD